MSAVEKASADAVQAAREAERYSEILAVVAAVQAAQAQQQQCQHPPVQQSSNSAAKWVGIGVGGSVFMVAFAVSAVAVATGLVCATVCVVILRQVWQDMQKKGGR